MFNNLVKQISGLIVVMVMLIGMTNPIRLARAAPYQNQHSAGPGPQVISASVHDKSRPLRSITSIPATNAPTQLRNRLVIPRILNSAAMTSESHCAKRSSVKNFVRP
jgi:hypothetical protein